MFQVENAIYKPNRDPFEGDFGPKNVKFGLKNVEFIHNIRILPMLNQGSLGQDIF